MKRVLAIIALLASPRIAVAQQAETIEYYGKDLLGSVRIVWDAAGNRLARQDYTPFGTPVSVAAAMPKEGFTGQEMDAETGQGYFHARMLAARTGRFTKPDPLSGPASDPQQWNRYAYARSNPLRFTDPSGLTLGGPCGYTPDGIPRYCGDPTTPDGDTGGTGPDIPGRGPDSPTSCGDLPFPSVAGGGGDCDHDGHDDDGGPTMPPGGDPDGCDGLVAGLCGPPQGRPTPPGNPTPPAPAPPAGGGYNSYLNMRFVSMMPKYCGGETFVYAGKEFAIYKAVEGEAFGFVGHSSEDGWNGGLLGGVGAFGHLAGYEGGYSQKKGWFGNGLGMGSVAEGKGHLGWLASIKDGVLTVSGLIGYGVGGIGFSRSIAFQCPGH